MTEEQIQLVQTSFAQLTPIAHTVPALFYGRLFELAPMLKELFRNDMQTQGAKLMQALALVVESLHNLAPLLPMVQALGKRHVHYGVQAADYDTVGAALLWTLEQGLGSAFTPATRDAWTQAYTTLATVMRDAAAKAATEAA